VLAIGIGYWYQYAGPAATTTTRQRTGITRDNPNRAQSHLSSNSPSADFPASAAAAPQAQQISPAGGCGDVAYALS
jgi:hypothetical protein